ncbi:protein GAMETE EXPRESSED 1 [Mercurialis annua]|uniref:protein GAMETE EXPRESSED 1 n=1 Tax=Mercurialis annua TaxID=3986 RepID=UPI00215E1930|nr:protein GAMETE EXPRESSED 1 [Mercurialis annua]
MGKYFKVYFLLILMAISPKCIQSWGWFSSSSNNNPSADTDNSSGRKYLYGNSVAEFSIDGLKDEKGMKLIENAKNKLQGSNSCWQNAYQQLFAGCSQILAVEEKRSRLAWHLSDCFQKDSGRPSFPNCDTKSSMLNCLKKLNDNEHKVYLEFALETNSICYQLQAHSFKQKMESLVNDLKDSAELTTDQLQVIHEKTESLSKSSDEIHETLISVDVHVHNVAQATKDVKQNVDILSTHTESVYKQSKEIADSQSELRNEQVRMNDKLKEGMETIQDSYNNLGQQVDNLRNEAVEIEKQIGVVGETMSLKMQSLQISADEIEVKAEKSLDKQQLLIDGQSTALKGLQLITEFQSEALEESRSTLQSFAEYGRKQQEELLQRQQQIQQVHDHLIENSKSILAAQEAFESKQESIFIALDKLFALHNAMLLESRILKSFFIYFMSIFVVYMLTSTKQTYSIRARLYIGLIVSFLIEVVVFRSTADNIEKPTWAINSVRLFYAASAFSQFVYAICTYKDLEVLNHHAILEVNEKVNAVLRIYKQSLWDDDEINWSSFVETELPDEVDRLEDPDFIMPEEVAENSISSLTSLTRRRYDLRSRNRQLQNY